MSRTDKDRPLDVKMWDFYDRIHKQAHHDHSVSVCDLPENYEEHINQVRRWYGSKCYWDFDYTGIHICCCWMCHRSDEDLNKRNNVRMELRAYQKLFNAGEPLD